MTPQVATTALGRSGEQTTSTLDVVTGAFSYSGQASREAAHGRTLREDLDGTPGEETGRLAYRDAAARL